MKIIDLNHTLIEKAQALGFNAVCDDYFRVANETPRAVLMTASNPAYTFGGGIDAVFYDKYKGLCQYKQSKGGGQERIGNICFCITVGHDYRATKETIKSALKFAIHNTDDDEELLISGVGTGIGGLSVDDFLEVLTSI